MYDYLHFTVITNDEGDSGACMHPSTEHRGAQSWKLEMTVLSDVLVAISVHE